MTTQPTAPKSKRSTPNSTRPIVPGSRGMQLELAFETDLVDPRAEQRADAARRAIVVRALPVVVSLASQLRSTAMSMPAAPGRPMRAACSSSPRMSVA